MTRPSVPSETPSGRKDWVQNSNGKPNNWATNLSHRTQGCITNRFSTRGVPWQLHSPPRLSSIYASLRPSRQQRKTRGRVDRYSCLLTLFHPLHSSPVIPAH